MSRDIKKIDPAMLEIIRNYFSAICGGMAHVIERTSYSSYVTESADFATALATPEGDFFAYPQSAGVSNFLGLSLTRALEELGGNEDIDEGDIIITNDPYTTDGLSTHLPDIHIFKPVYWEGELVCYAWSFIHSGDVGGSVPSSLTPAATDIQMEGLRIPPVKYYTKGVPNDAIRKIVLSGSRVPNLLLGDLNSMISAANTAERKMHEAIAKFGIEAVRESAYALLEQSEMRARKIFGRIPDGEYSFSDYLDDDVETEVPLRVAVTVKVEGSDITLDFSDCDPQTKTAFNLITNGSRHAYLYQGLISHIISEDPFIPMNGGMTFPIHIIAPKGSITNAEYPAAGGIRHPVSLRLFNAVLGALAQVIPDHLQAAGGGQAAIVTLSLPDESRGGAYAATVVEPMGGGGGAQCGEDGNHAVDSAAAYLKNTPIESLEQRTSILVHEYELIPNSAGAGKYRGGNAIRLDFEPLRDEALVGARGQERLRFQPWGLNGGKAGELGHVYLNPDAECEEQAKLKMLPVKKHDIISFRSPSGGGWGDPLERDPEAVLQDVIDGLLDAEHAKVQYGVVIAYAEQAGARDGGAAAYTEHVKEQSAGVATCTDDAKDGSVTDGAGKNVKPCSRPYVEAEKTTECREKMKNCRDAAFGAVSDAAGSSDTSVSVKSIYDFGEAREKYEALWTPEASTYLANRLKELNVSRRSACKHRAHEKLAGLGRGITMADIDKIWGEIV